MHRTALHSIGNQVWVSLEKHWTRLVKDAINPDRIFENVRRVQHAVKVLDKMISPPRLLSSLATFF
eukprot:1490121-Amphidinium_carterae.2